MLAADLVNSAETVAVIVAALVGALWGVPATLGWKSVADARKERIVDIEAEQRLSLERELVLTKRVTELEARPDMTVIRDEFRARHAEVIGVVREMKEIVDDIASRWG